MSNELKVKVGRVEELVLCRIISQPDDWRCNSGVPLNFTASNGFRITSAVAPELFETKLFVRGTEHQQDSRLVYRRCTDVTDAQKLVKNLCGAVREFNSQRRDEQPAESAWTLESVVAR